MSDEESKAFEAWRDQMKDSLPELAKRVFALRDKFYTGCGFHYGLECSLGRVIAGINNHDRNYYHLKEGMANRIALEVEVEHFNKSLAAAEASAAKIATEGLPKG